MIWNFYLQSVEAGDPGWLKCRNYKYARGYIRLAGAIDFRLSNHGYDASFAGCLPRSIDQLTAAATLSVIRPRIVKSPISAISVKPAPARNVTFAPAMPDYPAELINFPARCWQGTLKLRTLPDRDSDAGFKVQQSSAAGLPCGIWLCPA
jgi:hypothetical protein